MKDWSVRVSEDKNKTFLGGGGRPWITSSVKQHSPDTKDFIFSFPISRNCSESGRREKF